ASLDVERDVGDCADDADPAAEQPARGNLELFPDVLHLKDHTNAGRVDSASHWGRTMSRCGTLLLAPTAYFHRVTGKWVEAGEQVVWPFSFQGRIRRYAILLGARTARRESTPGGHVARLRGRARDGAQRHSCPDRTGGNRVQKRVSIGMARLAEQR